MYFSRSGEASAYTRAPLPRLASGKAFTLLTSLALACAKALFKSFSLGPKKLPKKGKDLIQEKSRILSAADMRPELGDHIMP